MWFRGTPAYRGTGADAVLEAAGGKDTFQTAWKIARPNAVVCVVAMYEEAQVILFLICMGKTLFLRPVEWTPPAGNHGTDPRRQA